MATPQVKAIPGMTPLGFSDKMSRIELLANEIALLSNDSLQNLAHELVKNYAPRADVFEANLSAEFFYNNQGEIVNG
jgi:hypothetical protein